MRDRPPVPALTLRRTMGVVHAGLGELPYARADEDVPAWLMRWRQATRALAETLRAEQGAAIAEKSSGLTTVRIHGIRASSTGGIAGALRNWVAAADRELARRQKEGAA